MRGRVPVLVVGVAMTIVSAGQLGPVGPTAVAATPPAAQELPNMGQQLTPLAPTGATFQGLDPELPGHPGWLAGQAVTSVVSPDQRTMLVLTSGYNRVYRADGVRDAGGSLFDWPASQEYVFVYDITSGAPVKTQVLTVPNTYNGIAFDPSGTAFYVSGGIGDFPFDATGAVNPAKSPGDNVHIFTLDPATDRWSHAVELLLGHEAGNGLEVQPQTGEQLGPNERVAVDPCAAGVAISADGQLLVVANHYNDSVTVFTGGLGHWSAGTELDLRPGRIDPAQAGVPGGEYPFWVAVAGTGAEATAYVSSIRDREIVVVEGLDGAPAVTARIPVTGQPNKMTLDAARGLLYVVEDQSDQVTIIDTATNAVIASIPVLAEAAVLPQQLAGYKGANPDSATLTPDGSQLWVPLGTLNAVAVIVLAPDGRDGDVAGFIPTGWYPNSVSFDADGSWAYVINGKSPTGPNPDFLYAYGPPDRPTGLTTNTYNPQLTKAGLQAFPVPGPAELSALSAQVALNDRFGQQVSAEDQAVLDAVHAGVKHVVFVIKENRTYDQVLGDAAVGNGDPSLAEFGLPLTPNQHALASTFVTLDDLYATAEVSYDGWAWSTAAQAQDVVERQYSVYYAGRGLSMDAGGTGLTRGVNTTPETPEDRVAANPLTPDDPDLLPGETEIGSPDGPENEINTGFLWDAALRAGLTVRNYGFFVDTTRYTFPQTSSYAVPLARDPAATGTVVAFPANASLAPFTDPWFRGWDPAYPDLYRYQEWKREFDLRYADGTADLPSLSLVRLMADHTGNFDTAIDGVNTPETQQADNDYALGLLVETIAHSRHAGDTLIFVIEDDSQDGPDHVDSHRTIAFVAGAYVKQGALVSTTFNTIDFVRTIEAVLGLPPMNINDALARPMADIFTRQPAAWDFTAQVPPILYCTQLPLPPKPAGLEVDCPAHDAAWWTDATAGMDFRSEDRVDFAAYNRITWAGLHADVPYPAGPTGLDLRADRAALLEAAGVAH